MEKKLNIYFNTDNKKTYHIALSFPKDDLSKATVEAVARKNCWYKSTNKRIRECIFYSYKYFSASSVSCSLIL